MASAELHVELLLGRLVRDSEGRRLGRLEEVRAERVGGETRVTEYLIGPLGAAHRIGLANLHFAALGLLGLAFRGGYRVPWQAMDLNDPARPRTRCPRRELQARDDGGR